MRHTLFTPNHGGREARKFETRALIIYLGMNAVRFLNYVINVLLGYGNRAPVLRKTQP